MRPLHGRVCVPCRSRMVRCVDFDVLRAFVSVARAGGFSAAARAERTTQPSLSRRVQQLERHVGARLVARGARGIVLTRAGERFLVHAERALRAVEAGMLEVEDLTETPHGAVAIGTMPSVSAHVLPDLLAKYVAAHPTVRVRTREGFPAELEGWVASGELDLAVFNLPVRRGDLAARRLWQEDYLLVVPEGHRLATRGRIDLVDAAGEPFVVIPDVPATHALIAACDERGVPAKIALETDTLEGVRRLVARGVGVSLLPRMLALEPGRGVVALEVGRGGLKRQVAVVHRGEGYLTAAARALRAMLLRFQR